MSNLEGPPIHILVVDDDCRLLRSYKQWLRDRGFVLVLAADLASATAALEEAARQEYFFDLVLLDYHLQGERGIDLIPAIKRLHPQATVAVVSAFLDAQVSIEVAFLCDFTVCKPVGEGDVDRMLQRVMQERRKETSGLAGLCQAFRLSPREIMVLEGALQRLTTRQLAQSCGVKESTISTYWRRIFNKTNCSSQRDVMALLANLR